MGLTADEQQKYIRINSDKLLSTLKENRERHLKLYNAAIVGWRKQYVEMLKEYADTCHAMAEKIGNPDVSPDEIKMLLPRIPPKPDNHTSDYDEIIAQVEFSLEVEFCLSHHNFARYILDKWDWKDVFIGSANLYSPELAKDFVK